MKLGFTTVTFRKKTAEENLALAVKNRADGIEWGGDVHVPPGEPTLAKIIAEKTNGSGLSVLSYGSYYKTEADPDGLKFAPVLETAKILGASVIRVWAGSRSPRDADEAYLSDVVQTVRAACDQASFDGITVAFEFHRNTLTETAESAAALIRRIDRPNVKCYWQPNPDLKTEENIGELLTIKPYLVKVHVFHWGEGGERRLLREGMEIWSRYREQLADRSDVDYILEFCRDDDEACFASDMETMRLLFR